MKEKTCFKSVENPSCVFTNNAMAFQNTSTVFMGLSDFYKLVLTVLKTSTIKSKPQKITYRRYKNFDSVRFNDELKYVIVKEKITSYTKSDEMFLRILNQHAPLKSKLLRANHTSYISKPLRKAIMKRSYLKKYIFQNTHRSLLKKLQKTKKLLQQTLQKREKKLF